MPNADARRKTGRFPIYAPIPAPRWFRRMAGRAILGVIAATGILAPSALPMKSDSCTIQASFTFEGVDARAARDFEASFCAAAEEVGRWWGVPYAGAYEIDVNPEYRYSMALVPAWRGHRGRMKFPAHRIEERRAAISHEITHVVAPNQNRFLAEGLAVYAQVVIGTNPAFPNFGRPLHTAALPYINLVTLSELDAIATPDRLEIEDVLDMKGAYLIAGSFVEFLIDTYGMEKFRTLYALTPLCPCHHDFSGSPRRWKEVYGHDLPALERAWRLYITVPVVAAAE